MNSKKTIITSFILFFSIYSYGQKLVELWRTGPAMKTPESALYSPELGVIFVSNINGNATAKDGNGFISLLAPDGAIRKMKWVTGLNAPKGLALYNGKLYVSDIDELVEIDIDSEKISNRFPAPGAIFLNDVAVAEDGKIYVSDGRTDKIHILDQGKLTVWLDDDQLKNINGLYVEGDMLYAGSAKIQRIDRNTKKIETIRNGCGGIDGLTKDNSGHFIFSNWPGRIFYLENGKMTKLIETAPEKINTADISFAGALNLLLVPTFNDNQIVAYQIEK